MHRTHEILQHGRDLASDVLRDGRFSPQQQSDMAQRARLNAARDARAMAQSEWNSVTRRAKDARAAYDAQLKATEDGVNWQRLTALQTEVDAVARSASTWDEITAHVDAHKSDPLAMRAWQSTGLAQVTLRTRHDLDPLALSGRNGAGVNELTENLRQYLQALESPTLRDARIASETATGAREALRVELSGVSATWTRTGELSLVGAGESGVFFDILQESTGRVATREVSPGRYVTETVYG